MDDWRDAARGDLARLVTLDRFAARGMVRGWHLGRDCALSLMQTLSEEPIAVFAFKKKFCFQTIAFIYYCGVCFAFN